MTLAVLAGIGLGAKQIAGYSKRASEAATPSRADLLDTTFVREGAFLITVPATGRLEANRTNNVYSPDMSAKLTYVAPDGVPVQKGDLLFKFDDTEFRRGVRERQLSYENAKADTLRNERDRDLQLRDVRGQVDRLTEELRILKEGNATDLRLAEAQLKFDEANFARASNELEQRKRQHAEKLIPLTELERAESDYRARQFAVEKSKKDLAVRQEKASATEQQKQMDLDTAKFTAETSERRAGDESGAGQQRIENLRRQLEFAQQQLDWCTIRAPASGLFLLTKVYQRSEGTRRASRVGDQVSSQNQLAEIPDLARMQIVCKVPERNIGSVRAGQEAILRLVERPETPFRGKVARVGGIASEVDPSDTSGLEPGTKVFGVNLDLVGRPPRDLLPGMTANVEIVTRRLVRAVYVRKECVFEDGDYHIVYKLKGNGFVKTRVTPGAENLELVEIQGEIRPGDQVARQRPLVSEGGAT
jgi:multidrug efflux pump subunit AcrA (membrane-fusion protein)